MKIAINALAACSVVLACATAASAETTENLGKEEFGLTERQLVEAIDKVESLIAKCMRDQGFEYVAVDSDTVRHAMKSDKQMPGVSDEEFVERYGFGLSTLYTGHPPQDSKQFSPAKIGIGERNVRTYMNLPPAARVAYNRALFGENVNATFAVTLEAENFSQTGGCTRAAVNQVFKPDELKATYYNPKDALINKDPRMKAALRKFAASMREAGFEYNHPDEVETDIAQRLSALTNGGTIPVDRLSPTQQAALRQLQDYERKVAKLTIELQEEYFEPVEEAIENEMFAREVK